jgi:hypothetical protein
VVAKDLRVYTDRQAFFGIKKFSSGGLMCWVLDTFYKRRKFKLLQSVVHFGVTHLALGLPMLLVMKMAAVASSPG